MYNIISVFNYYTNCTFCTGFYLMMRDTNFKILVDILSLNKIYFILRNHFLVMKLAMEFPNKNKVN